ncbi:MAG TPA: HAMP domain-containing sensor histidine kinase [Gaiellaceae bacterium]|nr:HAMP domain-containing sensor histidine kinase [Gaiellaceae bacterium]
MFRSLRFRLPAIFLAGLALAGLVATLLAIRLFQDYARDQTVAELRREAAGIAELYSEEAGRETLSATRLEEATGDRLYWVPLAEGASLFPGASFGLRPLPADAIDTARLEESGAITFEFTPPADDRPYLAVAHPLRIGEQTLGAIVAAKPKTELRERWMTLGARLGFAFLGGVLVAGALAWYLSRRITKPLLALSRAADAVAEGRRDVRLPSVPGGDEIAHLSERFEEMAERLRETEELERNFLMSVSHELRTPLTAIKGHVEALREGVVEDPELRAESLDVIAAETTRLERLVGDVLDLAKLDAHRFTVLREEVDMRRLVDRAYAAFGGEARRREIEYRQTVDAEPVIVSDGDRLLQIISNLLANAFRWTPDGGRIELGLAAENGTVSVTVEDSGSGISREERERIFRPFWSRDGGGTGLGLAIANELAVALGGRISVDSEPGRGSRFELRLPGGAAAYGAEPALGGRRSSMR